MHAIAHIELNAIDLAWDIIARFRNSDLPLAFYDDWVNVTNDEAKHFSMLTNYLNQNNACYGDFPIMTVCGNLQKKHLTIFFPD